MRVHTESPLGVGVEFGGGDGSGAGSFILFQNPTRANKLLKGKRGKQHCDAHVGTTRKHTSLSRHDF